QKTPPRVSQQFDDAVIKSEVADVIADHHVHPRRNLNAARPPANELTPVCKTSARKRLARHLDHLRRVDRDHAGGASLQAGETEHPRATANVSNDIGRLDDLLDSVCESCHPTSIGNVADMLVQK